MIIPLTLKHIKTTPILRASAVIAVLVAVAALAAAGAVTTNQYKAILGEEAAYVPLPIVLPIFLPSETTAFGAWRAGLNDILASYQLEGKDVSKFDVLYEIRNHPTYDPEWLKNEFISAVDTAPPNGNLIMLGHMTPKKYVPYRFMSFYPSGTLELIPFSWAVVGDVEVWADDVYLVTSSKPVTELPGLIVLIGCESLPEEAVEDPYMWAHTFKLSEDFYPYTIYWYQGGILGFNDTIGYGGFDVLDFVEKALEYAQTGSMGDALKQAAEEYNLNVVLQYYTGRYTYTYEYYGTGGSNTAVYIGDYDLRIDPSFDNEVAEKVVGYIGARYPEIYRFLRMISDGLIMIEVENTPPTVPGLRQRHQARDEVRQKHDGCRCEGTGLVNGVSLGREPDQVQHQRTNHDE